MKKEDYLARELYYEAKKYNLPFCLKDFYEMLNSMDKKEYYSWSNKDCQDVIRYCCINSFLKKYDQFSKKN